MKKKNIMSVVAAGVLISSLSADIVKAEGNEYGLSKKIIKQQSEKQIQENIIDSPIFNQLEQQLKGSQSYAIDSFNKAGITSSTYSDTDYLFEVEYNDDFESADRLSYKKPTIAQLLPLYDIDFFKVVVPTSGILLVGGATNSYAIDLLFAALQKDFVENKNLVYVGSEYDEGMEIQAYEAKAGTYYVGAIDNDNDYYDDNTEEDLYMISTAFIDTVAPLKPTVNKVTNKNTVVTGKAEANSTVTVKAGSKVLRTAKATAKGTFSIKIAVQKGGTVLKVTAKDSAGNVSPSASITVKDVIPPNKPTINKVTNKDKVIKGKAEVNAKVTVKAGSKLLGSATANSKGNYSVKISAQKTGTTISVSAKDKAGNVSKAATIKVVKP